MVDDGWKIVADELLAQMGGPAESKAIERWQREQDELRRQSNLREADVPKVLRDDLDSPDLDPTRHPIPAINAALERGQNMILLAGIPGTGKTVAAVYVVQFLRGAYFMRVPDYLQLLQSYKTQWDAERATLRTALVLDELGEEDDWHRAKVDQLLSGRYNMAPDSVTIVTTNLSVPAFRDAYGERIVSRFRDPRYCAIISCRDIVRPQRRKTR